MTKTPSPLTLITGGSRGLGRNMALAIARQGHDVILTYRSQQAEAAAVVAEIEALGQRAAALPLDVGQSDTFDAFVDAARAQLTSWGRDRFDHLVNNAGTVSYTHLTLPTN